MSEPIEIRQLGLSQISLIGDIDRSEHIDVEYTVVEGRLNERPVSMTDIPPWDPVGTGPYSVAAAVAFCEPLVAGGAAMLGAFEGERVLGLAVVDGSFQLPLAWLAFLHVTRPHRRRGVASALWTAAANVATRAGAQWLYVSAAPTGSAVGFYLSRGCDLADPVHSALYDAEPDDIHLICPIS